MISSRYRTNRPYTSATPRPQMDAQSRYRVYGPVQPMDEPSFLKRLFGRR